MNPTSERLTVGTNEILVGMHYPATISMWLPLAVATFKWDSITNVIWTPSGIWFTAIAGLQCDVTACVLRSTADEV